jgi:hypothetical protein
VHLRHHLRHMTKRTFTKRTIICGCALFVVLCWRLEPFKGFGIARFGYLVGHYMDNASTPRSIPPERWFSSTARLGRVESWYSMVFGLRFQDGEVWKRSVALPSREKMTGKMFEIQDIRFDMQGRSSVQLFEGHWVDDPSGQTIVLIYVTGDLSAVPWR